jgi:hypothetical protein
VSLETATTLAGLVITSPTTGDQVSQADDHLRLLKTVLKAQFPGAGSDGYNIPITATEVELNYVHGVTGPIQTQLNGVVPIGSIIMWGGVSIPTNWYLCDGTNGTPDLQDKFIVGKSATKAINTTGGSADAVVVSHAHTASSSGFVNINSGTENAAHAHTFTTSTANVDHLHAYTSTDTSGQVAASQGGGIAVGKQTSMTGAMNQNQNHAHTGTTATESAAHYHNVSGAVSVTTAVNANGVPATNANLPPYYALAFIQRYQ